MDPPLPGAAETRPGIGDLFSQLVDDTSAFIRAEITLYRARVGRQALSAGIVVALFGGAIVLLQGATIALLVGLIMALAPRVGIGWSITIVVLGAVALATGMARLGVGRVTRLIGSKGDE